MMIANEFDRITANYLYSADVQNSNFILVLILKKTLDLVRNEFGSV